MSMLAKTEYFYNAEVVRWVDADTVDLRVDLGFNIWLTERFRLARIDAWETRGEERPQGLEAKAAVERFTTVVVQTFKDKGKYGRWIAEIWAEGINVSDWLVDKGHAEYVTY